VEAKDTSDRDSALLPREVWICEPLIRQIEDFTVVEDLDAHDEPTPLFHVSKRTIQNWVTEAAENAATATGDEDFLKVSSHDFRRYFASHMLYRHGVDPEIVRQLGGWRSPRSMMEYLLLPDDVLAEELGEIGRLRERRTGRRPRSGRSPGRSKRATTPTGSVSRTRSPTRSRWSRRETSSSSPCDFRMKAAVLVTGHRLPLRPHKVGTEVFLVVNSAVARLTDRDGLLGLVADVMVVNRVLLYKGLYRQFKTF